MKRPLVSIVMSAYNERIDWVEKAVESVINQTYENIEFIIILDNPNNEIIRNRIVRYEDNDNRVRFIINEENIGLTKSLNLGLKLCSGEYIARMDADDVCALNRIEEQVYFLEENINIDLVSCNYTLIDEEDNEIYKTKNYGINKEMARECLAYRSIFAHPTWLFRKKILEKLNSYNDVERAEDYDFLCRLFSNGYYGVSLENSLMKCRSRVDGGISSSNLLRQKRIEYIIRKSYSEYLKKNIKYSTDEINSLIKHIVVTEKQKNKYKKSHEYYLKSISSYKAGMKIGFIVMVIKSIIYYPKRIDDLLSVFNMNRIRNCYKA